MPNRIMHVDAELTLLLAYCANEAYYYPPKSVPPGYEYVTHWTGRNPSIFGGDVETYGLVFKGNIPATIGNYIFTFKGTATFWDAYEDIFADYTPFIAYRNSSKQNQVEVADGFNSIYSTDTTSGGHDSMQKQLFGLLDQYKPKRLMITGHSLGSALAELFTLDLLISFPNLDFTVQHYNFACPRVGTAGFAHLYNELTQSSSKVQATIRIVNDKDIIPCVPFTIMDYKHGPDYFLCSFKERDAILPHFTVRHSIYNYFQVLLQVMHHPNQVYNGPVRGYHHVPLESYAPAAHLTECSLSDLADEMETSSQKIRALKLQSDTATAVKSNTPNSGSITIAYQNDVGAGYEKNYELLVVACDPRNLTKVCDYDDIELKIFSQLKNFTFHTTLVRVPVPKSTQKQKQKSNPIPAHGVIFSPFQLEKMSGRVYGFRNESAKTFGLKAANAMSENLVTIYQLLGPEEQPYSPEHFEEILKEDLETLDWWKYGTNYTIEESVTTPYFDHFSQTDLKDGLPWLWLDKQGDHRTLYVHASTCFESALDCWGYENMLLEERASALPDDKTAPIAIIGAGVSGLLFSVKLKRLGYTNIDILEKSDRCGGKTHTIKKDGPYPSGSDQPTYCELGTCYMSPAYDHMIKDLQAYLVGNEQIPFGNKVNRGIDTHGQLPSSFKIHGVIDNTEYVLRKAEAELGLGDGKLSSIRAKALIFEELLKYIILHREFFGQAFPMPSIAPKILLDEHASKTFSEFLSHYGLKGMIGTLQYGYEVQGYGVLDKIPAYYGLVWINPPIIEAIIKNSFIEIINDTGVPIEHLLHELSSHLHNEELKHLLESIIHTINKDLPKPIPIVTSWSEGWGDLWTQIVEKENLNILFKTEIMSIQRQ
ncbi:MAG: NAD(P)-binding protein [Bacteroidota bacterium]